MGRIDCKSHLPKPVPEDGSFTNTIWAVCYSPDGLFILVSVGDRVLFYKTENMEYDNFVKGHKDIVTCLAYSRDS